MHCFAAPLRLTSFLRPAFKAKIASPGSGNKMAVPLHGHGGPPELMMSSYEKERADRVAANMRKMEVRRRARNPS